MKLHNYLLFHHAYGPVNFHHSDKWSVQLPDDSGAEVLLAKFGDGFFKRLVDWVELRIKTGDGVPYGQLDWATLAKINRVMSSSEVLKVTP